MFQIAVMYMKSSFLKRYAIQFSALGPLMAKLPCNAYLTGANAFHLPSETSGDSSREQTWSREQLSTEVGGSSKTGTTSQAGSSR
jgi:hypothetical protein